MAELPNSRPAAHPHRPVFDVLPFLAWIADSAGSVKGCNRAWTDYTGLTTNSSSGEGWRSVLHPDDLPPVRNAWDDFVRSPHPVTVEARIQRAGGEFRWHELTFQKLPDPETDLIGIALDVHDRRQQEQHSRLLNQAAELLGSTLDPDRIYTHLRGLVASSMICDSLTVSLFDADQAVFRCAYAWLEGEVIDAESLPEIPLAPEGKGMQSTVIRTGEAMLVNDFEAAAANSVTVYHVDRDGQVDTSQSANAARTQAAILVPIKLDGQVLGVTRVLSNYRKDAYTPQQVRLLEALMSQVAAATRNAALYQRARQELDERIRAERQLREKQHEVDSLNARLMRAMRETHHRVKNNLQVVCALIDLQVDSGRQMLPVDEFRRLAEHVTGLASLHDLLTEVARDDSSAEMLSLRSAMQKLFPMLETVAHGRLVATEIEDLQLPVRQTTALAILVNELVANAVKHGSGAIELSCRMDADRARLEVVDQGPGFPPGFDASRAASTGLELVETLGRWDLRGETLYENRPEGGARAVVSFPVVTASAPR